MRTHKMPGLQDKQLSLGPWRRAGHRMVRNTLMHDRRLVGGHPWSSSLFMLSWVWTVLSGYHSA